MPLVLNGATSGSTTIQATDAVTATLTLPSSTGTLALSSALPSTSQLVKAWVNFQGGNGNTAGTINIPSILINSLSGNVSYIRFYANPTGNSPNIYAAGVTRQQAASTSAIFPEISRNTVISLDTSSENLAANIPVGITVTATPNG